MIAIAAHGASVPSRARFTGQCDGGENTSTPSCFGKSSRNRSAADTGGVPGQACCTPSSARADRPNHFLRIASRTMAPTPGECGRPRTLTRLTSRQNSEGRRSRAAVYASRSSAGGCSSPNTSGVKLDCETSTSSLGSTSKKRGLSMSRANRWTRKPFGATGFVPLATRSRAGRETRSAERDRGEPDSSRNPQDIPCGPAPPEGPRPRRGRRRKI